MTVSLDGDAGHRGFQARLTDDLRTEHPESPTSERVAGVWTIPTEDGVIIVPEKLLAWAAGRRAAAASGDTSERKHVRK